MLACAARPRKLVGRNATQREALAKNTSSGQENADAQAVPAIVMPCSSYRRAERCATRSQHSSWLPAVFILCSQFTTRYKHTYTTVWCTTTMTLDGTPLPSLDVAESGASDGGQVVSRAGASPGGLGFNPCILHSVSSSLFSPFLLRSLTESPDDASALFPQKRGYS